MNMKLICVLGALTLALGGCATVQTTSLKPGAKKVVTSAAAPAKKCQKVADLRAKQTDVLDAGPGLAHGAMNKLKNMAFDQGANYVQITKNYSISKGGAFTPEAISAVVVKGTAYACPRVSVASAA
jgi:hypothetical protein